MRLPAALKTANIKEIEWVKFANNIYILAKNEQQAWLISIESAKQVEPFSSATLQLQAKQLQTNAAIDSSDWLTNGDVYFHQDAQKHPECYELSFLMIQKPATTSMHTPLKY